MIRTRIRVVKRHAEVTGDGWPKGQLADCRVTEKDLALPSGIPPEPRRFSISSQIVPAALWTAGTFSLCWRI